MKQKKENAITAGGVMESFAEFIFKAKSLLKNVQDLADRITDVSYENYKKSMKIIKDFKNRTSL